MPRIRNTTVVWVNGQPYAAIRADGAASGPRVRPEPTDKVRRRRQRAARRWNRKR